MVTEALGILTQILAGITLLALLWLTARAFKKHPLWGAGVLLFSPVTATVFGIKYWDREKIPFLIYAGTFTTMLALLLSLFSTWGGWELIRVSRDVRQALDSDTLTQADADTFRKVSLSFAGKSGIDYRHKSLLAQIDDQLGNMTEAGQSAAESMAGGEQKSEEEYTLGDLYRKTVPAKIRYRLVYKPIRVADAHKYVGYTVKVTRKNVLEKEYRLTGASGEMLHFMQRGNSGSFSFALNTRDIDKIRVLTKEPY